ncbi:MAG TPA: diguanylate cyclase, partial [Candidatus Subteraquimicrobiales bacterium]
LRLRDEVEKLRIIPVIDQSPRKMTISIGLATAPEDAKTAEDLVDKADEALYKAKRAGGNTVFATRTAKGI